MDARERSLLARVMARLWLLHMYFMAHHAGVGTRCAPLLASRWMVQLYM